MASARYISRFLLASLAFLAVATTSASADKCAGGKVKAVGTKEAGLLTCQAKVAAKNDTSRLAACKSKAMAKFATTFVKAGTCVGDQTRCENVADGCDSAMAAFLTDTFPSKCESSKRKAAGKLASRELRCYSKATKKGLALDTSCITKAQGKFATALIKAGACPDGGSPQNEVENNCVQPAVTTNSGGMVTDVCPTCGMFLTAWGSGGSGDGQFNFPEGGAVDASGNVFIADVNNDRIQKFTNAGTFLTKWGSAGSGNGQFNIPTGVAVDVSGNVFVADNSNNRIQKFACP
jgi:DNA-binding beta-propeller fold protein YncE